MCEDVPDVHFCVSLVEADADAKCIASVSDDGTITLAGNPSLSISDEVTLARKAPPKKTPVRKPGDRLGFAISRPWDGSDMEIAVIVNGDVVERFDYCPSSCARQADEPYARLMAFYADSSASSMIDSNAAAATKISQHLAIIAGAGQAPAEEAVQTDLACAKDGHVTPALSALLTWHEIFDKYAYHSAPCPEREIRAQGLALMVMDLMSAASLPLFDDVLVHEVHKCAGEMRAAGLTSAGLSFEQFLTYAIANREAFEPILKETNLKKWSRKMNMSPDGGKPGDPSATSADPPSLHVKVWASGGKGSGHCGGISVDELLRVATETQQQTLAVALGIASCGKAQWLSRCARVAMDTISSIVNTSVDMPEVMTYQSPAKTTRVAGKDGTQASAPGAPAAPFSFTPAPKGQSPFEAGGGAAPISTFGGAAAPKSTFPVPISAPQTASAQAGATFRSSDASLQKHLDAVDASASADADLLRALDPNAGQWLNYLRTMYVFCLCCDNAAFAFARTRTLPPASGRLFMCTSQWSCPSLCPCLFLLSARKTI
jgi:hypothetical protein